MELYYREKFKFNCSLLSFCLGWYHTIGDWLMGRQLNVDYIELIILAGIIVKYMLNNFGHPTEDYPIYQS